MGGNFYVGVDVGTASVRACVVNSDGKILATSVEGITIWNPRPDYYQQSSINIWNAVIKTVKNAVTNANVEAHDVKGIGFDATCSLVVLDDDFQTLTVSLDGEADQNIIMWMDHRAKKEAEFITSTHHHVLKSIGGVMSLEMQPPKLMWIKQNLPKTWEKTGHFFDLPDFLTWTATGSLSRSMCSVVCKWGFQADDTGKMGWDDDFLSLTGLSDLSDNSFSKIGSKIQDVGSPCSSGLSQQAADQLGLAPGTPVGTSLIDAHAGALACVSCLPTSASLKLEMPELDNSLVLIAGTSTCHIICSQRQVLVPGVWGPYFSAIVPGNWVNEGGQSVAGRLLDFITFNHPSFPAVKSQAADKGLHPYQYLSDHLQKMAEQCKCSTVAHLTTDIHVWPDYHGNRSPVADANLKGMVCGLCLTATVDDLALQYLATVQALAYGTKHIVTEMERYGHSISHVFVCGGLRKNRLYVQIHSDVLGRHIILPDAEESVLLGAAMLGACASGNFGSLKSVMSSMGGQGTVVEPDRTTASKKFQVFLSMLDHQRKYRDLMKNIDDS